MKQSLQLKIGQQLKMTPQLQQAIKLLQLSSLDLQQEIQNAIDENPMLELAEEALNQNDSETTTEENLDATEPQESLADTGELWEDTIPEDLSIDTGWDEIYQAQTPSAPQSSQQDFDFDYKNAKPETLQDHLYWQLDVSSLVDSDRAMALAIIDAIGENGFLTTQPEMLFEQISVDSDIEFEDFEAVRTFIMQFDPVGAGSKDLAECLDFQLSLKPEATPFVNDARVIVSKHLQLLATHDYAQLKRKTRFKEGRLKEAVMLIQGLQPTPGDQFDPAPVEYITPDVFVRKIKGQWMIELNNDSSPQLAINTEYANLIKRADNSSDNNYLKDSLQEAKWLIKSLQSRNETLMKVATKIVEHQIGFLEYGEEAMKPLVLHDIADSVDMHESTISRVTTRKYIHTPRGIFELKYFFSSHVSTNTGGECSSTAIRAMIKKLIAAEDTRKPLSDNKIATLLTDDGINVARRTVAKYRESMNIPPSNERKRL